MTPVLTNSTALGHTIPTAATTTTAEAFNTCHASGSVLEVQVTGPEPECLAACHDPHVFLAGNELAMAGTDRDPVQYFQLLFKGSLPSSFWDTFRVIMSRCMGVTQAGQR
jgi:hypothetical protein